MRTKPCSFAHLRMSASVAVAAPIVDQWTASKPCRTSRSIQLGDRFMSTSNFTAGEAELRLPRPARRRRTGPRQCPRPPGRDTHAESRLLCVPRRQPDHGAYRNAHAPNAGLSAHYGGVTSDACQVRHTGRLHGAERLFRISTAVCAKTARPPVRLATTLESAEGRHRAVQTVHGQRGLQAVAD